MKKLVKILSSIALCASFVLSLTGCAITEVKTVSDDIMQNTFDFKGKKVTKYFNEDDKYYEDNKKLFEEYMNNFVGLIDTEYEEVKVNNRNIKVNNDEASVDMVFEIDGENFDFELNLVKEDDEWIIEDNEEFMISAWALYFDIGLENGSKNAKNKIEDMMDGYEVDNTYDLAEAFYEYSANMLFE